MQDHIICEDSRSKVVIEDAYLGQQNSQTLHLRLVKGNATCGISNDHQQGGAYPNVSAPPEHTSSSCIAYENVNRCIQSDSPRVENNISPLIENVRQQMEQGDLHRFQTREVK